MPKPLLARTNETPSSHGKTGCPAWIRTKTEASKGPSATITLPDNFGAHSSLPSGPAQRKTPPLDCRAAAAGDDDDTGLDCGAATDGNLDASGAPAVLAGQETEAD